MARRGRQRDHSISTHPIANRRLLQHDPLIRSVTSPLTWSPVLAPQTTRSIPDVPLAQIEDRRLFHPLRQYRPPRRLDGTTARIGVADRRPSRQQVKRSFATKQHHAIRSQTKGFLTFQEPANVVVCVRRQRRKEVLFATGGAGKRSKRPPRRNAFSSISCR